MRKELIHTQRNTNPHTEEYKSTHRGIQIHTQRNTNPHTEEYKSTHRGIQIHTQRNTNPHTEEYKDVAYLLLMTSLTFILVCVPDPVCQTTRGKWSSSFPSCNYKTNKKIRSIQTPQDAHASHKPRWRPLLWLPRPFCPARNARR